MWPHIKKQFIKYMSRIHFTPKTKNHYEKVLGFLDIMFLVFNLKKLLTAICFNIIIFILLFVKKFKTQFKNV